MLSKVIGSIEYHTHLMPKVKTEWTAEHGVGRQLS